MASRSSRSASSPLRSSARATIAGIVSFLKAIAIIAVLALAIRSFVIQPFTIPSASMLPTIFVGDDLLVAKWPFGYSRYSFPIEIGSLHSRFWSSLPHRGDVIVFRHPAASTDLIKRVIGLPGDIVAVRDGRLILNGRLVDGPTRKEIAIPVSPNSPCASNGSLGGT